MVMGATSIYHRHNCILWPGRDLKGNIMLTRSGILFIYMGCLKMADGAGLEPAFRYFRRIRAHVFFLLFSWL